MFSTRWRNLLFTLFLLQVASASLYRSVPNVETIETVKDWEQRVTNDAGIWMVQFCSSEKKSCENLVPQYTLLGNIAAGIYHIAFVDTSTPEGQSIGEKFDGTKTSPSLLLFGDDKQQPTKYRGEKDAQNMLQSIMELALETLRTRAGPGGGGGDSRGSSSGGGGGSGRGGTKSGGASKVLQITSENFGSEILNNPLVSAIACKFCSCCCCCCCCLLLCETLVPHLPREEENVGNTDLYTKVGNFPCHESSRSLSRF